MLEVTRYVRKPFIVQAVEVTAENMYEVADWCGGTVQTAPSGSNYIKVDVKNPHNERQTMAFAGSFVLLAENGYKVFPAKPFKNSYEEFFESRCGGTQTADGKPCVLGVGHKLSSRVATGCRSLQDYKVISPASPIVRQAWVDPNMDCV